MKPCANYLNKPLDKKWIEYHIGNCEECSSFYQESVNAHFKNEKPVLPETYFQEFPDRVLFRIRKRQNLEQPRLFWAGSTSVAATILIAFLFTVDAKDQAEPGIPGNRYCQFLSNKHLSISFGYSSGRRVGFAGNSGRVDGCWR